MTELTKNQIIELEITATGVEGEGIGRHEGLAIFVPAAAQGDTLRVRIVKVCRNMAYGRIEEIISPSPDRVDPQCSAFPQCGGCAFRHISYDAECRVKRQRVIDAMKRIGGIDIEPERFIACDSPDRYRNKAQFPCERARDGSIRFGFYAGRSHRIVGCEDCALQPEGFAHITRTMAAYMDISGAEPYDEATHEGLVRHLYLRRSRHTGQIAVCIVANGARLPREDLLVSMMREADSSISGVIININRERTNVILGERSRVLWGEECITDRLLGVDFSISPLSFFQINPAQTERLYGVAAEYAGLTGRETVLDMYCGAGTIGLTMAAQVGRLIGVEVIPEAVADARENARRAGIDNAEFICGDASAAAAELARRSISPDVMILDPPRKGCDAAMPDIAAKLAPRRIVYVSCDPATLARDLARFAERGYIAERLTAVDMFPRTRHVETVVLMTKE